MLYQKGDLVHIPSDVTIYQNTFGSAKLLAFKGKTSYPTIAVYLKQINYHFSLVTTVRGNKQIIKTDNLSFVKGVSDVS
jgi:hypothetical protein